MPRTHRDTRIGSGSVSVAMAAAGGRLRRPLDPPAVDRLLRNEEAAELLPLPSA